MMSAMQTRPKAKVFTLRHFLFYMGVAAVLGVIVAVAQNIMHWSDGLTFAVLVVSFTISATWALREDLFAPTRRSAKQRTRRLS